MRESQRSQLGRRALVWGIALLLSVAAAVVTLSALGGSVYGAPAFVSRYLQSIGGDDIAEAIRMPGVAVPATQFAALELAAETSSTLLRSGVISSGPRHISVVRDVAHSNGSHTVTMRFELAGSEQQADYTVAPLPALGGVIPRWRFEASPLGIMSVTVSSGHAFSIGDLTFDVRNASAAPTDGTPRVASYLVPAPAVIDLGYSSELVVATDTPVIVPTGARVSASVLVLPTPTLIERVQSKLDSFLTECAAQKVLQPTGCPFGTVIDDRVLGDPVWSLVSNPIVSLAPEGGAFMMPATPGKAHVAVPIERLFDGERTTIDTDVDYAVGLVVTMLDDGSIAIQLG